MTQALLFGIHDREGRHILPPGGWCVDTVSLLRDQPPTDYTALRADINWIVRLNWGYGSEGTIPLPHEYYKMAKDCAYYVAKSKGASRWIIGNEPNHENERPNGVYITPEQYARCFTMCRATIKGVDPAAQVIPAPCAPYHANPIDWTIYLREVINLIASSGGCDGIAIHAYTRGSDPAAITSGAKMGPPLQDQFSGFWTYMDAIACVSDIIPGLPAYITEFNELLPDGWDNRNTGVVQEAYSHIDWWNKHAADANDLLIQCLVLYRWPRYDKWHIEGKQGVIDDFKQAIGRGYTSPVNGTNAVSEQTTQLPHIPHDAPATAPTLPPYPADWDPRLTERGVKIERVKPGAPGTLAWVVTKGRWLDEQESGGRHHFYADVYADNEPVVGAILAAHWPGDGYATFEAEAKPGNEPMANFPMSKSLNEFSFQVNEPKHPSDRVTGVGMGANGNPAIHTSTYIEWTLYRTPQPQPTTQHIPSVIAPGPTPPPQEASQVAYVIAPAGARLRDRAPDGDTLAIVPHRGAVTALSTQVLGDDETWARVRYGELEGWMAHWLLGPTKPVAEPQPVTETAPPPAGIIEPRVAQAILAVESGGRTHGNTGAPLIRFEAHIFKSKLGNDPTWAEFFRTDPQRGWVNQEWRRFTGDAWKPIHTGAQADEYAAFEFARSINADAAYQSISVGAAQIMGFNHARIGYPSAQAMFEAFHSAQAQTIGFINFFLSDPALMGAARRKDWRTVAAKYNGTGQIDHYAGLLQQAYEALA